jgi:signal transduction histidine kinase
VVHPEDRDDLLRGLRHPGAEPLRIRWVRTDGTLVWTEARSTLIRDERGRVVAAEGVARDVTDRVRAEEQLRSMLDQLHVLDGERRRLLHGLVEAQEEERRRIAGDIHDDPVQVMTSTAIRLEMLQANVEDPALAADLARLEVTARRAIDRLRRLLFELRPRALDEEGLGRALTLHLSSLSPDDADPIDYRLDDRMEAEPPPESRAIAFRIVQEALTNARKHSRASKVVVELATEGRGIVVRVRDDGVGFVPDRARQRSGDRLGLISIRERAEAGGGWCRVWSSPGNGAIVECWLPVEPAPGSDPA